MPGDHGGAERADQQGDHREDARLGEYRDTDRHADRQQPAEFGPGGAVKTLEQPAGSVIFGTAYPEQHGQGHEQHDQPGCPAAADAAHGRHAELAVDEDVIERDVQQQAEDADHHAGPSVPEAVAVAAQHLVQRHRRKAARHGAQIGHAGFDQCLLDLQQMQHRLGVPHQHRSQAADTHAHP